MQRLNPPPFTFEPLPLALTVARQMTEPRSPASGSSDSTEPVVPTGNEGNAGERGPMSSRKLVTMTAEMAREIDEYRWGNRIGSEAEALRRIIAAGLAALASPCRGDSRDTR